MPRQVELIAFQKSDKNPAKIDQSWRDFFYVRAKRPSTPNGRFLSVLTRIIQLDRRKITTSNTGIVNTYNDCFHPKNQKRYKTSTIGSGKFKENKLKTRKHLYFISYSTTERAIKYSVNGKLIQRLE
nr:hypothetical protein [uncultured Cohaesibacter sp.]